MWVIRLRGGRMKQLEFDIQAYNSLIYNLQERLHKCYQELNKEIDKKEWIHWNAKLLATKGVVWDVFYAMKNRDLDKAIAFRKKCLRGVEK